MSSAAASSSTTAAPHLLDFLELIEARKVHAKTVLKQQVDTILEDLFSQLVSEFRQMLKVAVGECSPPVKSAELLLSKVESVVCEPIIEMCLMEEGRSTQTPISSQLEEPAKSSTTQGDPIKAAKSSPQSSKAAPKRARKSPPPQVIKVEKMEVDSGKDDDDDQDDMSTTYSILSSSLKCAKENYHNQRQSTFQRAGQLLHASHVFEVHQVSAASQPLDQSPPPPLEPPPLLPPASQLPCLAPTSDNTNSTLTTPWICPICEKKMKNERTLYMHQWRYHKAGEFRCENCPFVASYRIQLRTHQIRFHDLGKFSCPFPGCGRSFNRRNSLKRHERIHLRLRPYRCKVCDYASELRSSMIDHVRVTHFRLPRSRKEQLEMSIGDDRDPADYFEVIQEGLDLLEPVLEHVHSVLEAQQVAAVAVAHGDRSAGGKLVTTTTNAKEDKEAKPTTETQST